MNRLSLTKIALVGCISAAGMASASVFAMNDISASDNTATLTAVNPTQLHRTIIRFQPSVNPVEATFESVMSTSGNASVSLLETLPSIHSAVALLTAEQIQSLSKHSAIVSVEPDQRRTVQFQREGYALPMIQALDMPLAVDHPQKVCVIDTGVASDHPDIPTANLSGEVSNTLGENINLGNWFDDDYGHGTFITGLLTAIDDREGIQGVVGDGSLAVHQVKVIHNPNYWQLWSSDVIAGIDACLQAGSTVINLSIAGRHSTQAEQAAVTQAFEAGALLVGAGGNRGSSDYFYPASYDEVIAVNAIDSLQQGWRYNQHHDQTELVAPGVGVRSTMPGDQYAVWDGTSVASPFVTGAAALVWSRFPDCSNQELRNALQQSALDLGDAGRDDQYGFGLVQVQGAINWLTQNNCGNQSMIGDVITTRRNYPAIGTDYGVGPITTTVEEGNSDAFLRGRGLRIDIESDYIYFDFLDRSLFGGGENTFDGITFKGFSKPVKNVTATSVNITVYDIEWGDDYIYVNLTGGFNSSSSIRLDVTF